MVIIKLINNSNNIMFDNLPEIQPSPISRQGWREKQKPTSKENVRTSKTPDQKPLIGTKEGQNELNAQAMKISQETKTNWTSGKIQPDISIPTPPESSTSRQGWREQVIKKIPEKPQKD